MSIPTSTNNLMKAALGVMIKQEFDGIADEMQELVKRVRRLPLTENQIQDIKRQADELLYSLGRKTMGNAS